jgi:hypothetical protein
MSEGRKCAPVSNRQLPNGAVTIGVRPDKPARRVSLKPQVADAGLERRPLEA